MTKKNTGYQINEKDIEATLKYLKLNGEPEATRDDAIQYLEEHQVMAHVAAHKIVEDEESNKVQEFEEEDKPYRYAIWYEPTGEVYQELKSMMLDLSDKYDSPIFEPHITLLPGGTELSKDEVTVKLKKVVSTTKPFKTTFDSYEQSDNFFRSIFLKVNKSDSLTKFAQKIQEEFNDEVTSDHYPHLSVLYSDHDEEERKQIIEYLGKNYEKSFVIKEVKVIQYRFGEPVESWKEVASVELSKD